MSRTIPTAFTGIPSLSEEKVEAIKAWYIRDLGDSDKAAAGFDDGYYTGKAEAYENVLLLLFDITLPVH
jgi:hypothetical protein